LVEKNGQRIEFNGLSVRIEGEKDGLNKNSTSASVTKMETETADDKRESTRVAVIVWLVFFAVTVSVNLLIPLLFGLNLHEWTYSNTKGLLLFAVNYAGIFLILPLILTKGWATFKKPSFFLPVVVAAISVVMWYPLHYVATIAIIVLVYLHWRFDLSELGFRSKGWKGDAAAIGIVGALGLLQGAFSSTTLQFAVLPALSATVFRMFGNPASTVENLFYFGFLTNRLGKSLNRYAVPFIVGVLYTFHEMSNPEYWYEGSSFIFVFIGVTIFAAVYLWRRSIVVTWLSDGLQWFMSRII